jgi:hypothetical protein
MRAVKALEAFLRLWSLNRDYLQSLSERSQSVYTKIS